MKRSDILDVLLLCVDGLLITDRDFDAECIIRAIYALTNKKTLLRFVNGHQPLDNLIRRHVTGIVFKINYLQNEDDLVAYAKRNFFTVANFLFDYDQKYRLHKIYLKTLKSCNTREESLEIRKAFDRFDFENVTPSTKIRKELNRVMKKHDSLKWKFPKCYEKYSEPVACPRSHFNYLKEDDIVENEHSAFHNEYCKDIAEFFKNNKDRFYDFDDTYECHNQLDLDDR